MYRLHRERLLQRLSEEGLAAIIPTGSIPTRNADCDYRFRPDSDFWYLTGFDEPESVLVLLPDGDLRSVLFLREKNKTEEIWTGVRVGTEAGCEVLGVDAAYPVDEIRE